MVIIIVGLLSSIAVERYTKVSVEKHTDLREKALHESAAYDDAIRKHKVEKDIAIQSIIDSDPTNPFGITVPDALPPPPAEFVSAIATSTTPPPPTP